MVNATLNLSLCHQVARTNAARTVFRYRLPADYREDLRQEALTVLWTKRNSFDATRGSWRTFAERVVRNRIASLLRSRSWQTDQTNSEEIIESLHAASFAQGVDLRASVLQVLSGVNAFDRRVAISLAERSASETAEALGSSRATIYRSINRLRAAFESGGFDAGVRR